MNGEYIEDMKEFHKDNTVHFQLKMKDKVDKIDNVEKVLRLTSSISTNNYVLFDKNCQIKRYKDELEILQEFFDVRYNLYVKRKEHQIKAI